MSQVSNLHRGCIISVHYRNQRVVLVNIPSVAYWIPQHWFGDVTMCQDCKLVLGSKYVLLKGIFVGGNTEAGLSVLMAYLYLSSSRVMQGLPSDLFPYSANEYFLAAGKISSRECVVPNDANTGNSSTFWTSLLNAVFLPILKRLLVESHPVNACAAGKARHTAGPSRSQIG